MSPTIASRTPTDCSLPSGTEKKEYWRLIITRHSDSEVLIRTMCRRYWLPVAVTPAMQRVAPNLLSVAQKELGLEVICRFRSTAKNADVDGAAQQYCVLELCGGESAPANGYFWTPVPSIEWERFGSEIESQLLRDALSLAEGYNCGVLAGRFVQTNWLSEVERWVQPCLQGHGLKLTGKCTQYNTGPDFSLVRFETNGSPVWFKAVGEPNLREFAITVTVAGLHSSHLPTVLATHRRWNAWLMVDAGGCSLGDIAGPEPWMIAARSLADLQIESLPRVDALLAAGCDDLRSPALAGQIQRFLSLIAALMQLQPGCPPRRLGLRDLRLIERQLIACCDELSGIGVPAALGQTDLNPGNIFIVDQQAVFIDWMMGHVGHPFLTFEYLLALMRRIGAEPERWLPSVREEYLGPWRNVCSTEQLARSLKFTPLTALFAYALMCSQKRTNEQEIEPSTGRLLRSLARRISVEAEILEDFSSRSAEMLVSEFHHGSG